MSQPDNPVVGTYCVVIGEQLAVQSCPLPKGVCMWKHRLHGRCMYSEDFVDSRFTANEYAKRVGLPPIDPPLFTILKNSVLHNLKKDIAS